MVAHGATTGNWTPSANVHVVIDNFQRVSSQSLPDSKPRGDLTQHLKCTKRGRPDDFDSAVHDHKNPRIDTSILSPHEPPRKVRKVSSGPSIR
jgi:hypothetical protein